jgi:hypothetical protein
MCCDNKQSLISNFIAYMEDVQELSRSLLRCLCVIDASDSLIQCVARPLDNFRTHCCTYFVEKEYEEWNVESVRRRWFLVSESSPATHLSSSKHRHWLATWFFIAHTDRTVDRPTDGISRVRKGRSPVWTSVRPAFTAPDASSSFLSTVFPAAHAIRPIDPLSPIPTAHKKSLAVRPYRPSIKAGRWSDRSIAYYPTSRNVNWWWHTYTAPWRQANSTRTWE